MIRRRNILFGALASILATPAYAATPFNTFAYPATGATASRNTPDRFGDFVNVKDYGAVGDGSTDDTSSIKSAIAAAVSQGGARGATIYFPGTANFYKISSSLIFNQTSSKGIVFRGDGAGTDNGVLGSVIKGSVTAPTNNNISSITWSANVVTFNLSSAISGITAGTQIEITIAANATSSLNGSFLATIGSGATSFTYALSGSGSPAVGSTTYALVPLGYCLSSYDNANGNAGCLVVEDLQISNTATTTFTGAFYQSTTIAGQLRTCKLDGFCAVLLSINSISTSLMDCDIGCSTPLSIGNGSFGIQLGNANSVYNCDMSGFDNGIRMTNKAPLVQGGRIERCSKGIVVGKDQFGNSDQASNFFIAGVSMEANDTGISVLAGADGQITAVSPAGTANSPSGDGIVGIDMTGASSTAVIGCSPSGNYTTSSFVVPDNQPSNTFISCLPNNSGVGTVWSNTTGAHGWGAAYIACNQPVQYTTFSNVTSSPKVGTQQWFSDSSTATFGAIITGSGANKVLGQYDGTNWRVAMLGT